MNKTARYEITVIIPVFNEQDNLSRLETEMAAFLERSIMKSCVLFVNDGSTDKSGELLREICSRRKAMFYLSFDCNRGLSAAIKAGIDHTFSEYAGYIDADLQTNPEDFNMLLALAPRFPLVMGIRTIRRDGFIKRASSRFANIFRRMFTGDEVIDTGCPLKVIRTDYAKRMPFFTGMHRFIPALIRMQEGGTVKQIPVGHYPRTAGVSHFNIWNRLGGSLRDCFAVHWMKKRYINYTVTHCNIQDAF